MPWNEPYAKVLPIPITVPKTVVNVPERYHPGQGDLVVYYNGVIAVPGEDYTETSPWSITFKFTLNPPDTITLRYQKLW